MYCNIYQQGTLKYILVFIDLGLIWKKSNFAVKLVLNESCWFFKNFIWFYLDRTPTKRYLVAMSATGTSYDSVIQVQHHQLKEHIYMYYNR